MSTRPTAIAALLAAGLAPSLTAGVITQVVPPAYTNQAGTGSFLGPLTVGPRINQYLIHESLLTDLVGLQLTGISFRLGSGSTSAWPGEDAVFSNYDIFLSGSVAPADRSLENLASNVVGPRTQVRSGALTVAANAYTFGGSPNAFGPTIEFSQGWLYSGGNLLVEIRHGGNSFGSRAVDALTTSTPGYGTLFSTAWSSNPDSLTGLQGNFSIMQLTAIPAPGALALLGVAGLAARRRRRG